MASAPVWLPAQDERFYQHAVQRVAQSSLPNWLTYVLPNSARIKSSSDFARVTKTGRRTTTNSLIGYFLIGDQNQSTKPAKLGLIIGKSVGNSVVRHRIARQVRHAVREQINNLPNGTMLVIRAMKKPENAFQETLELLAKHQKVKA